MSSVSAAFADAGYAYRKVFGSWGRIVRYAGLPALVALALVLLVILASPEALRGEKMDFSADPRLTLALIPAGICFAFASALFMQRWWRFEVTGEDAARFRSFPFGDTRVWTFVGVSIVLTLVFILLSGAVMVPAVMLLGAAVKTAPAWVKVVLVVPVFLAALALAFLLLARLGIGLVPTALNERTCIRDAFDATAGRTAYFLGLLAAVYLPSLLVRTIAGFLLALSGLPPGIAKLGGELTIVPFYAVGAIIAAGLFRDVVQPWREAQGRLAAA